MNPVWLARASGFIGYVHQPLLCRAGKHDLKKCGERVRTYKINGKSYTYARCKKCASEAASKSRRLRLERLAQSRAG